MDWKSDWEEMEEQKLQEEREKREAEALSEEETSEKKASEMSDMSEMSESSDEPARNAAVETPKAAPKAQATPKAQPTQDMAHNHPNQQHPNQEHNQLDHPNQLDHQNQQRGHQHENPSDETQYDEQREVRRDERRKHSGPAVATIRIGASDEGLFVVPDASQGSSFFVPKSIAAAENIQIDMRISQETLQRLHEASSLWRVRKKAVDLLARREHSRQELSLKLQQRSFQEDLVRKVIQEMEEKDYLNDRRFAVMWVRSRLRRHPEGPVKLTAGLQEKGVSRDIINSVLGEELTEEVQQEALERAIEKLAKKRGMNRDKMLSSLVRLGFSYHRVRHLVDELYR